MNHAPVHIVVLADPRVAERYYGARGDRLYSVQNCAAAIENMLLFKEAQTARKSAEIASQAYAATADHRRILGRTRILDLGIEASTARATHD